MWGIEIHRSFTSSRSLSLDFSEAGLHWRQCQPSQIRRCRPSSNARSRGGAPSRSFPTPTPARPRSPRSCCSTPARSSWPARCAGARPAGTRRPTGWRWSRSAASRSPRRRWSSSSNGCRITLLDTPGHQDFSEDTYRTLIAADSVVMVIDAAKGIEEQTRKLFEVCRRHRLPILTFINKFDQPGARSAGAARRDRARCSASPPRR